jgi:hypothetical protein
LSSSSSRFGALTAIVGMAWILLSGAILLS